MGKHPAEAIEADLVLLGLSDIETRLKVLKGRNTKINLEAIASDGGKDHCIRTGQ